MRRPAHGRSTITGALWAAKSGWEQHNLKAEPVGTWGCSNWHPTTEFIRFGMLGHRNQEELIRTNIVWKIPSWCQIITSVLRRYITCALNQHLRILCVHVNGGCYLQPNHSFAQKILSLIFREPHVYLSRGSDVNFFRLNASPKLRKTERDATRAHKIHS